jgi:hypothetical protein
MMRQRIVTDEDVDRALAFLRDSAIAIGSARENMVNASNYIKHVEALLYLASDAKTVDGKKAEVKCKQQWLDAGAAEAKAAGEFEKLKALREAAAAKIEAWRSESANYRGMKL